jgi:hypothetical protein
MYEWHNIVERSHNFYSSSAFLVAWYHFTQGQGICGEFMSPETINHAYVFKQCFWYFCPIVATFRISWRILIFGLQNTIKGNSVQWKSISHMREAWRKERVEEGITRFRDYANSPKMNTNQTDQYSLLTQPTYPVHVSQISPSSDITCITTATEISYNKLRVKRQHKTKFTNLYTIREICFPIWNYKV